MTATIFAASCEICYGITKLRAEKRRTRGKEGAKGTSCCEISFHTKGFQHREGSEGVPDPTNVFTEQSRNTHPVISTFYGTENLVRNSRFKSNICCLYSLVIQDLRP